MATPNQPTAFTPAAAQRIAKAVRRVEAMQADDAGTGERSRETEFWAEITGVYNSTTGYPWKMKIATAAGGLSDHVPSITGTGAFEINGDQTLTSGKKVRLRLVGHDGSGNPRYLFTVGGGLTLGTAQYQIYQMVTPTAAGWDYPLVP